MRNAGCLSISTKILINNCLLIFLDVKGQKHKMVFLPFHPVSRMAIFFGLKLGDIGLDFLLNVFEKDAEIRGEIQTIPESVNKK